MLQDLAGRPSFVQPPTFHSCRAAVEGAIFGILAFWVQEKQGLSNHSLGYLTRGRRCFCGGIPSYTASSQ